MSICVQQRRRTHMMVCLLQGTTYAQMTSMTHTSSSNSLLLKPTKHLPVPRGVGIDIGNASNSIVLTNTSHTVTYTIPE
ncbi:hypothetical protein D9758_017959 [Tetrapyrgos nigripes]|uniref:Uncharacterized protein n=1 Tax=Tetrapyrgos nigripes TaxID=182062 RepID=A0A8H5FFU0_9AGAR|nr:hypothetical protein D9758_017959 [Tetrapyrgos nigripes]